MVQVVAHPDSSPAAHAAAQDVRAEWVLQVRGSVRRRPAGMENPSQSRRIFQSFLMSPLTFFIGVLFSFLILLVLSRMGSTEGNYKQVLAAVVHANIIDKVLGNAVRLVLALTRQSLMQTSTGLALLFPKLEVTSTAYIMMSQIDLFQFWMFGILGFGLAAIFKISLRKALVLSYAMWFLKALANIGIGIIGMSFLR
ncbi:MAG: hypothetical protein HGA24_00435 [Candidatus Aminicenantes bacterium]|nr:hypothetical protein [Candidatus Aminicenantes bacterium]